MQTSTKKLLCFYLLALLITWGAWLPLVLNYQLKAELWVLPYQHYAGSFGPLLAAVLTTLLFDGTRGVARLSSRCFRKTGNFLLYLVVIITPVLCFGVAVVLNYFIIGEWPDWASVGITRQLPGFSLLSAWLFWVLTFGIGEETGWRGFALYELQKRMKPLVASLLLGGMWIFWHIPAFFYDQEYLAMSGFALLGWLLTILYGSVFFSWLCNTAQSSIIPVALWHGTFDALIACDAAGGAVPGVMSMLVILFAVLIMKKTKGLLGYKPHSR